MRKRQWNFTEEEKELASIFNQEIRNLIGILRDSGKEYTVTVEEFKSLKNLTVKEKQNIIASTNRGR